MTITDENQLDEEEARKAKNRLTGMVVHEVSLVDRAANKRTFLMTKRDNTMGAKVKKEDGAPGATEDDDKPGDLPAGAEKAGETLQAAVKDSLLASITAAGEKIVALGNAVQDMPVSDGPTDPIVPPSVLSGINEVGQMLATIVSQNAQENGAPQVQQSADGATEQAPQPGGSPFDPTTKAGRKMSAANLSKFKNAISTLRGLFSAVSQAPTPAAPPQVAPAAGAPLAAAPVAANVEPAVLAAKSAAGRPVMHASGISPEVEQVLKQATSAIEETHATNQALLQKSAALESQIAELRAENSRLSKATGSPRGGTFEGTRPQPVDTTWPLDLAPPHKQSR